MSTMVSDPLTDAHNRVGHSRHASLDARPPNSRIGDSDAHDVSTRAITEGDATEDIGMEEKRHQAARLNSVKFRSQAIATSLNLPGMAKIEKGDIDLSGLQSRHQMRPFLNRLFCQRDHVGTIATRVQVRGQIDERSFGATNTQFGCDPSDRNRLFLKGLGWHGTVDVYDAG